MTTPTILTFSSHDGSTLHYRHWPARNPSGRALLLFHRGHEHGGRVAHLVDELALPDMDVFAWDARGHGLNEGPRGYAPNMGCLTRDVESFVAHLAATHGLQLDQTIVIAQSVGAVIATSWVHDYAPRLRGLVLASPAFSVNLYVPAAIPGLKLLQAFRGDFFVNSYVKAHYLTHDPERQASFNSDPLITRPIASNILLELYDVADRLIEDAGAIQVPTLMLVSGKDYVVRKAPQQEFFLRLGASMKRWVTLKGFFHDTLGELGRETALRHIRQFVDECFEQPAAPVRFPALLQAHKRGFTFDEFETLSKPATPAWRDAMFRLVRGLMQHVGARLSRGIKIGVEPGFDSGAMLDYVYLNQPQGAGPLGGSSTATTSTPSAGAASASAASISRTCSPRRSARRGPKANRCESSISPRAMAATCSMPWRPSGWSTGTASCCGTGAKRTSRRAGGSSTPWACRPRSNSSGAMPSTRRVCRPSTSARRLPSSPGCTNCSRTTTWFPIPCAGSPRRWRRAAGCSTPASPGIRNWSSSPAC